MSTSTTACDTCGKPSKEYVHGGGTDGQYACADDLPATRAYWRAEAEQRATKKAAE